MTARPNLVLDLTTEIIVDLFAGGGGVSEGIEMALGFPPHVAVNHNDHALSMHRINHPFTRHHIADVFEICPRGVVEFHRRPVGALHLSPDCTHHSQAAGGQPRNRKIRALSWVAVRWAGQVRPRVITLENVKQILKWGPLVAKRDKATGRVLKLDGTVAEPGERVPLEQQFLVPDPKRAGQTWRHFVRTLRGMGYRVETRQIVAADCGSGTTRERLYMVARCDGKPIVWETPSHATTPAKGQKPWKPAADSIDWSIPCPSIFTRRKPLAPATMKRIAKGMERYVLKAAKPFIVPIAHYNGSTTAHPASEPLRTITAATKGGEFSVVAPTIIPATHHGPARTNDVKNPMPTITAAHRGELMVSAPVLIQAGHGEGTSDKPRHSHGHNDIQGPLGTIVASGGGHSLTSAYLMQANGGFNITPGHDAMEPMSTITNTGSQQQLVAAHLTTLRKGCDGRGLDEPSPTITAGAEHHAVIEYHLSPEDEAGALRVAAFLMEYYSEGGQWSALDRPLNTITTRDRLALVTVTIQGTPYVIVDIGLRMLTPRELYNAQGFRPDYIIDHGHDGRKFTKEQQVRMVGNSVPPQVIASIYRANLGDMAIRRAA